MRCPIIKQVSHKSQLKIATCRHLGFRRLMTILFALLLTGCATLSAPTPNQSFQLTGKIAIQAQNHVQTANLLWINQGEQYKAILSDPFGLPQFVLIGTPTTLVIEGPDGKQTTPSRSKRIFIDQIVSFIQAFPKTTLENARLPKKLQLSLSGVTIKLVVYSWHPLPSILPHPA